MSAPTKRDYQKAVAATSPQSTIAQSLIPKGLEQDKRTTLAAIVPLVDGVKALAKGRVRTAEQYLDADTLRGRIKAARKSWGGIWDGIQTKTIKPIRAGLEALYETNRAIDGPLEDMENTVTGLMKDYKNEEARQIREAQAATEREERRLLAEAQAIADKLAADKPPTPFQRAKLVDKMDSIEARIQDTVQEMADTRAAAVQGVSSTTRAVKVWRVKELADVLQGILDGKIPDDVIGINNVIVNRYFKNEREAMEKWPGFAIEDDTQIVGR